MVYGICDFPLSKSEEVKNLGVAGKLIYLAETISGSKTLTEEQREDLFKIIDENKEFIGWAMDISSPNYLSNSMLRR